MDGASYGVPLSRVIEVIPRVWLTPLPSAPSHVAGAFAYRGRVAVALDIRRRLGLPARSELLTDHFVVTRGRLTTIAIIADQVLGVRTLSAESVHPSPVPSPAIAGIVARADGLLVVDDLDALLSAEEDAVTERALQALSS